MDKVQEAKKEIELMQKALQAKEEEMQKMLEELKKEAEKKEEEKPAEEEGKKKSKKDLKKEEKKAKKPAQQQQAQIEFVPGVFGPSAMVQSKTYHATKWTEVEEVVPEMVDQEVTVRARLHSTRKVSGKLAFAVLRHQASTIQLVMAEAETLPRDCLKWVCSLPLESVVDVVAKVTTPKDPVVSCTQQNVELQLVKFFLVSTSLPVLPFQLRDASAPVNASEEGSVSQDTRLTTRWMDMRTPCNLAIWTIQARVCQYFREYLTGERFVEIHTPKIIPAASEGGASVFKLGYFDRNAYLAQSPQLYKQIALQGDLDRVFEIGPVFRAENANTHRHLCEFVGLDVEMTIKEHYYEVLDVAEQLFTYIFDSLHQHCAPLIENVRAQFDHTPFVHKMSEEKVKELGLGVIEEKVESKDQYGGLVRNMATRVLRLSYPRAVSLLNTAIEEKMEETDDLSTTNEKILGRLVKERYGVDFFILDWFPAAVRPFYTMPHPENPKFSNSYDMFMRGEEISSGAQRIHDPELLEELVKKHDVDVTPLKDYINSFRLGAWPHGGFGVGLERVVMLFLGLHNIRSCSLFPRDPKRNTP